MTILLQAQMCGFVFLFASATTSPRQNDSQKSDAPDFKFAAEPFNEQVISDRVRSLGDATLGGESEEDHIEALLDSYTDEEEQLEQELVLQDESTQYEDDYFEVEVLTSQEEDQEEDDYSLSIVIEPVDDDFDTENHQIEDDWVVDKNHNRSQLMKHPVLASAVIL
ncbi:unnamed protein product [Cylicocyclus nassatus]|uniref:Uncharacterized protein n=1 Tax=Cylicocyclus nassatus TaxID=53992 RepID=A0AA36H150_CYLNA|nr:unnamed protein product [Cylicocyclus nassatus]